MDFIVKNGPFVKTKNSKLSIELTLLLTLIPFLIYRIISNPLNNFIILLVSILSTLIISIFIDYLINKKIEFKNNINALSYSIIISILIPINTPYVFIFTINIILVIISKFYKFLNYKSLLLFLLYFLTSFNKNTIIISEYNIYIYMLLLIIMLLILIIKRAIKFRITIMFILVAIIGSIFKLNIDENIFILMFSALYLIPDFYSSPNNAFIQYIYGITIGLFSIFIPITYLFLVIVILSILFRKLDRYCTYYLSNL